MKARLHDQGQKTGGMSKKKMILGAAGLLLFIVGVRRSLRTDAGELADEAPPPGREAYDPDGEDGAD